MKYSGHDGGEGRPERTKGYKLKAKHGKPKQNVGGGVMPGN